MKAKISLITFLIVSASLSLIVSAALAEGIFSDWAYATNDGNVPVILHVKTGENKYTEIQLEPGKGIVLPAGSQEVTAFPLKGRLAEGEQMSVKTNLFSETFNRLPHTITEPGKSIKFPRPSIAVTPEIRKGMKDDVVFAPGALAPVEEVREETKEEIKEEAKKEAPIDDKEFLHEQNKMYMEKKQRLEEIDPDSAEAGVISGALKIWEKDIDRMTKEAEYKYGPDWREQYRDSNGKLPGGFIEDDKSKLIKLKERRKEQQGKVDGLKSEFEELKKRLQPVEPRWEDRLTKDQKKFREKFIEEHGPSDTWDEETRKKYSEGFNGLTKESRKQWEKDKAEQAEVNRAIGRKIKEIAQEQAELNLMDEAIELQDKKVAEKPYLTGARQESPQGTEPLLQAIDEIEQMIRFVEAEEKKHNETIKKGRFMKGYYTELAGIPESELGRSVYILTGEDAWPSDYPEWLAQTIPGDTISGEISPYWHIVPKLKASVGHIQGNSEYYRKNPPAQEMNYLRKGLYEWQKALAEYHNALDNYYEVLANFVKYTRYYDRVRRDKLEEIDRKYAGRDNDKFQMAKYDVEVKAVEDWWQKLKPEEELYYNKLHSGEEAYNRVAKAAEAKMFNSLRDEFENSINITQKNKEYMGCEERLNDKKLEKSKRKNLEQQRDSLKKQIGDMIKNEQKARGENWRDRLRDPVTGELPGGLITDKGLDKLKTMYNKRKGRMAYQVGALGIEEDWANKPLPEDKLYNFLGVPVGKLRT